MKQEILNFQFLDYNKDFYVSVKNKIAFEYVQKWPKWNTKLTYVYGPEKCGKTLLSNMWAEKSDAILLDEKILKEFISNEVNIEHIKNKNWIIDDVEFFLKEKFDEKILNLINIITTSKNSFILITSKFSPKFLQTNIKDLLSRLSSSFVIQVFEPDNVLLCKIIEKYLNDRSITISKKSLDYLALRIERSYKTALEIARKIDNLSMENHSRINYNFLKSLID
tara:strand:+ start:1450 stop:2118 length:669 start_codon:yes stop_codon:yes gene_type:complete